MKSKSQVITLMDYNISSYMGGINMKMAFCMCSKFKQANTKHPGLSHIFCNKANDILQRIVLLNYIMSTLPGLSLNNISVIPITH